ncbi:hypothetical protein I4U23_014909 [Adineta vaga]|nr:hypothetical protein I4U23_014909 [Adineta vaga]
MYLTNSLFALFILFIFNHYFTQGQNLTNVNETSTVAISLTTNISSTVPCPENNPNCLFIKNEVKPSHQKSVGGVRRLFFLFLGCLLTTCLIIAMIVAYNRVTNQQRHQPLNLRHRFQNFLQTIGLNNFNKRGRFPFFSATNNNPNTHSSGTHRQGETSRAHLNENQDEALLFDDPYADGGISSGLHSSSINPYKSLTLSVA